MEGGNGTTPHTGDTYPYVTDMVNSGRGIYNNFGGSIDACLLHV